MAMAFSILGSGSAGNCTVLRLNGAERARHVLIDCGLSPRLTARRLEMLGLTLAEIDEIIVTHLDHDHFRPTWLGAIQRHDIRLHIHRRHRSRAAGNGARFDRIELFEDGIDLDGTTIETVPFAHDSLGTVGFLIEHDGVRLGWATDLGRVPGHLFQRFVDLDALAFESNYDRDMQLASHRPPFLKRRIMGGSGHLSNEQALQAIARVAEQSNLQHLALLHLSRECNCPDLLRSLYEREAPDLAEILTVTCQHRPSDVLHVAPRERLNGSREGAAAATWPGLLFR